MKWLCVFILSHEKTKFVGESKLVKWLYIFMFDNDHRVTRHKLPECMQAKKTCRVQIHALQLCEKQMMNKRSHYANRFVKIARVPPQKIREMMNKRSHDANRFGKVARFQHQKLLRIIRRQFIGRVTIANARGGFDHGFGWGGVEKNGGQNVSGHQL